MKDIQNTNKNINELITINNQSIQVYDTETLTQLKALGYIN
jgi:hypothetical protein